MVVEDKSTTFQPLPKEIRRCKEWKIYLRSEEEDSDPG